MKLRKLLASLIIVLAVGLALPAWAPAEVVGHITQAEGRVDILKGGKLPATPAKLQDGVEAGDVLRTKSLSKAQITFIDNSVITLSPESRLAVDEYRFDPAQQKRQAVLNIFQGLAHVLVNKLFKVEEPDFVIKTNTAVTGVRGTDFGVRLQANSSTILNFKGLTQVSNIFPEVSHLFPKALKVAYAFGPPGSPNSVLLKDMQGTTVGWRLPPTLPFTLTPEDRQLFMNQMVSGLLGRKQDQVAGLVAGLDVSPASSPASTSTVPAVAPLGLTSGTGSTMLAILNTVTVPPKLPETSPVSGLTSTPSSTPTTTPVATPTTFSFTQQYYTAWTLVSSSPFSSATLLAYSWGYRTGVYEGYFYATTEATRTSLSNQTNFFSALATGTSTGIATGTVTGFPGQALTGTMTYTGINSYGSTITRTGTVTILPTGELIYNWTDTVTGSGGVAKGTGTTTQTPGTYFSQTASGQVSTTANLAGNQSTVTNNGDLTGTRTMAGISSSFKAGFSFTNTATNANTFSSSEPTSISISSEGVLGAPDASGVRPGVMTSLATTGSGSAASGGPIRYVPATASTPDAMFAQVIGNPPGTKYVSLGMWAQTADSSAQIITQTNQGTFTVASSSPNTTGTLSGSGWGYRMESLGGSSSMSYPSTGSLSATITDTGGGTLGSNPEVLNQTVAAVVTSSGSNRTGPAQGVGIVTPNGLINTTGTVTIDSSNNLTHNFNGTWVSPTSQGTLTSGTQTMTPGVYFEQTTNSGTGSVISQSQQGTGPYTQTSTLAATMTRTGVAPATNLTLSLSPPTTTITSSSQVSGAFPSAGTVLANTNIQGVVTSGGSGTIQSGNMTMTVNPTTTPQTVSTFVGPVSINTATNALDATVVGRNPANPGVNQVPARQAGIVAQR